MSESTSLRRASLPFIEVLAISIALVGPTMTPVLIAPYMYSVAGNGAWLAYLLGTVMILFVALNLNQFSRRSSSTGSIFTTIAETLGPRSGVTAGWALLWAYVLVAAAVTGAMTLFGTQLLDDLGLHVPAAVIMCVVAAGCWLLGFRGIQLSALVMLSLEAASVALVSALVVLVMVHHSPVDHAQLSLEGAHWSGIGLGLATAIFSFIGFESATAFGEEARNPLVTIPRAVLWSVVIAGAFFVVVAYAEILGLRESPQPIDQLASPLVTLAELQHAGVLRIPITLGAFVSAFSVCLACVTTSARILLAMARQGKLPAPLAAIQPVHNTPYVATTVVSVVMLAIALSMLAAHVAPVDIFNDCGALASCAFIVIYALIAIAAPRFVRRSEKPRPLDWAYAILALVFLVIPAVTFFYPPPPSPTNLFPYLFVAYMVAGLGWFEWQARRRAQPSA